MSAETAGNPFGLWLCPPQFPIPCSCGHDAGLAFRFQIIFRKRRHCDNLYGVKAKLARGGEPRVLFEQEAFQFYLSIFSVVC